MITCRIFIVLFLLMPPLHSFTGKSFLTYRSQGSYYSHKSLNYNPIEYNAFPHSFEASVSYGQSFDSHAIKNYFFTHNPLVFSGSLYSSRSKSDILADYFGLPTDFKSTLSFHPKVQNAIADINFYWNLDHAKEGLFLQINTPFAYSKWELNPCEKVIAPGSLDYPAGYMSDMRIARSELKKGALDVLQCGQSFGDLLHPLRHGRIAKKRDAFKCADIMTSLGYVFAKHKNNYCAINAQIVVPTGTRSHAQYLFEPQIGNGHHWALGAGLSGNYEFCTHGAWEWDAKFDAQFQHLFKTTQKRSYDLKKNGPGSRYMLLEDMVEGLAVTEGFSGGIQPSPMLDHFYIKRLLYAIDATTFDSKIQIDIEANINALLKARYNKWSTHIGYNLWARSHERLISREKLDHRVYGVKGDAQVYGFQDVTFAMIAIPVNATQSQATLFKGQGAGNTNNNFVNSNADNAALIYNATFPLQQTDSNSLSGTGITVQTQTNGSNQAIVLTDCDIDNRSGLSPAALTHTIFGEMGYTWQENAERDVYCALGAQAEFAQKIDCYKGAISQWNTWIKVEISY